MQIFVDISEKRSIIRIVRRNPETDFVFHVFFTLISKLLNPEGDAAASLFGFFPNKKKTLANALYILYNRKW